MATNAPHKPEDTLVTAIIRISSIDLLKTFINAANCTAKVLLWQTLVHITFLFPALAMACSDGLMSHTLEADH